MAVIGSGAGAGPLGPGPPPSKALLGWAVSGSFHGVVAQAGRGRFPASRVLLEPFEPLFSVKVVMLLTPVLSAEMLSWARELLSQSRVLWALAGVCGQLSVWDLFQHLRCHHSTAGSALSSFQCV